MSRAARLPLATGLPLTAGLLLAAPAAAQEDFRSLDPGRPLRVADAYPKKLFEWEVQVGGRGGWAEAETEVSGSLELSTGLLPNLEVGVELEPLYRDPDGEDGSGGFEGAGLHALYNFNQEGWSWPGLALRLEAKAPMAGAPGRERWGWGGRLVATRSFASRARLHGNAGYRSAAAVDGGDTWLAGAAADVPLALRSRLLLAGVWAEVPAEAGRSRVWAEAGSRLQLTNRIVLDAGLATRLDEWADGNGNVELVLGVSRSFGIRGLMPVPDYPEPAIR